MNVLGRINNAINTSKLQKHRIASSLDIHPCGLWARMKGRTEWRLSEIEKLSKVLGIPMEVIFYEDPVRPPGFEPGLSGV